MKYREMIFAGALTGASLVAATASAAFKTPWDGEWVGATNKGDPVDVTISGPSVSGYQFKGQGVTGKFFDRSAEDGGLSRRLSERRDPSHADAARAPRPIPIPRLMADMRRAS